MFRSTAADARSHRPAGTGVSLGGCHGGIPGAALRDALPDVAFLSVRSVYRDLQERDAPGRALSEVLWVLGLIVFTVAMGGLCGLMAYSAASRRREFGIRKALGATTPLLCRMLARENSRVLLGGVGLGI